MLRACLKIVNTPNQRPFAIFNQGLVNKPKSQPIHAPSGAKEPQGA